MHKEAYYIITSFLTLVLSLIAARKTMTQESFFLRLEHRWDFVKNRLIWIIILMYFSLFSILAVMKFKAYNMAMVDLGRMDQAIWNTLHGRFLFCTLESGNACRLSMHAEFIYILIAPLYLVSPSPATLLILQTLIVSLGALPVFWLAKEKLTSLFAGLCFSCAYLLHPALEYGNLLDFHPDMLAATFLLFSFYYLEKAKWLKYSVFLILSLMCKEYVSLVVVMLGVYIFIYKKGARGPAVITFVSGILWFWLTYKLIPGYLLEGKENIKIELYNQVGISIYTVARNIVLHPVSTVLKYMTADKIASLLLLLLPAGLLSLWNIPTLLIPLPIFIGLILTPYFSYTNHHNGTILPFIFISCILGANYLFHKFKSNFNKLNYALGAFVFSAGLLSNIFYGPSPLSWRFWNPQSYRYFGNLQQFMITEHDRVADKFLALIPPDAAISASNHLASHLSQRETIYHFPHPEDFKQVDFVLVDLLEYFPPPWLPRQEERVKLKALLEGNFGLEFWQDGILLLKKGLKEEESYFLNIAKIQSAVPKTLINLSFRERVRLIGYDLPKEYLERGKRYRIVYYWQVLQGFSRDFSYTYFGSTERLNTDFIIIDILKGKNTDFRIVHLPAYILYPPQDWKAGDIIREEFDLYIPADIKAGIYNWNIGLYAVPKFFFIETKPESLLPGTARIGLGDIEVK